MKRSQELLMQWTVEALFAHGGKASVVEVSRSIWALHESEIRQSGDLLYSWQYDLRWAAQKLRSVGQLRRADAQADRAWELATQPSAPTRAPSASASAWSPEEIAVTVDSYFRMLNAEIRGETYRKTDENRRVVAATGRSRGAVEFKFANVSGVLDEMGLRYVLGYKPRFNYQEDLKHAVVDAIRTEAAIGSADEGDSDALLELDDR